MGWTTGVRFRTGTENVPLSHRVQTGSGVHTASYQSTGGSFPGVNLTKHLHRVPRLRMRGAIPPPLYIFMAWCLVKERIRVNGVVLIYAQGKPYLYLSFCVFIFLLKTKIRSAV
jgi:hypothetical protein